MIGWLLASIVIYATYIHFQYSPSLKPYFWFAGPLLGLACHIVWMLWCRQMSTSNELFVNGFWYWQVAVMGTIVGLPVLFYGVNLQPLGWAGVIFATLGMACLYFGTKGTA